MLLLECNIITQRMYTKICSEYVVNVLMKGKEIWIGVLKCFLPTIILSSEAEQGQSNNYLNKSKKTVLEEFGIKLIKITVILLTMLPYTIDNTNISHKNSINCIFVLNNCLLALSNIFLIIPLIFTKKTYLSWPVNLSDKYSFDKWCF